MFACMVATSRILDPLLEMFNPNDVGLPIASCDSDLDGDYF